MINDAILIRRFNSDPEFKELVYRLKKELKEFSEKDIEMALAKAVRMHQLEKSINDRQMFEEEYICRFSSTQIGKRKL